MSTKAIREALERLRVLERRGDGEFERIDAADEEVEAIERAAKVADVVGMKFPLYNDGISKEQWQNATDAFSGIAKDAP